METTEWGTNPALRARCDLRHVWDRGAILGLRTGSEAAAGDWALTALLRVPKLLTGWARAAPPILGIGWSDASEGRQPFAVWRRPQVVEDQKW